MKLLDLIILVISVTSGWFGYKKGILMEIFQSLGLLIGLFLGFQLLDSGVQFVKLRFEYQGVFAPIFGYLVMVIAIYFIIVIVGKVFKWTINKSIFGIFDKLAGFLLGVTKVFLVLAMFLWSVQKYSFLININLITGNSLICEFITTNLSIIA